MQELFLNLFLNFFCREICSGFTRLYQDRKINAILFLNFFKLFFAPVFAPENRLRLRACIKAGK
jgi:hypothetical protein